MTDKPQNPDRRALLAGMAMVGWGVAETLTALPALAAPVAPPPEDAIAATLLGTGSPELRLNRFGGSTLVQAGPHNLLFDAGRGCTLRLGQLGIPLGAVDCVFLTHFHSDHVNGLPDLWMTGYIRAPYASRRAPLRVIGPTGTRNLVQAMHTAFGDDIRIRMADEKTPELATELAPEEFTADGVVFDQDGVRVTAFEVDHGALVKPAYGYRIDFAGRSVVVSGDTRFNENVIAHATGVDLLVHEVCAISEALAGNEMAEIILAHHTAPERAGEVFTRAHPRLAAYTHVGQIAWPPAPPVTVADIIRRTRASYAGPLEVGEDLTRFIITATDVRVLRWDSAQGGYGNG